MESDQCILVDEADSSLGSATKRHCKGCYFINSPRIAYYR